jgi:hypothetical protein
MFGDASAVAALAGSGVGGTTAAGTATSAAVDAAVVEAGLTCVAGVWRLITDARVAAEVATAGGVTIVSSGGPAASTSQVAAAAPRVAAGSESKAATSTARQASFIFDVIMKISSLNEAKCRLRTTRLCWLA